MKRIMLLIVCMIASGLLCSCGGSEPETKTAPEISEAEIVETVPEVSKAEIAETAPQTSAIESVEAAAAVALTEEPQSDPVDKQMNKSTIDADVIAPESSEAYAEKQSSASPLALETYVLNNNTKRFHNPKCSSVQEIKPSNREDVEATREDLIAQGYMPCGRCKP